MEIEQRDPRKPNFALVVALFCVTLIVIFAAALLVLHHRGKKAGPSEQINPNAMLRVTPHRVTA